MAYILNSAKTLRNLRRLNALTGAFPPYAYWTAGKRILEFYEAPNDKSTPHPIDLKPGSTFYQDGYLGLVTIQGGSGHVYQVDQVFPGGSSGADSYGSYVSDWTTAKGRNSSGVWYTDEVVAGQLVPDAVHYIYASILDDAGNPDYYVYVDTLQPERGVHPYTRDLSIGSFKTLPRTIGYTTKTGRPIMDLATRVRNLEGVLRAGRAAGSAVQDDRMAKLVARLVAFETWANGAGHFGTPPAVGSSTVYTEDQFIQAGDQA